MTLAKRIKVAWVRYRIRTALDEMTLYTQAGIVGPRYIANVLMYVARLEDSICD